VFAACALFGALLLAAGTLLVIADADGLSSRMPTQIPPKRFARPLFLVGAALLIIGAVGSLLS